VQISCADDEYDRNPVIGRRGDVTLTFDDSQGYRFELHRSPTPVFTPNFGTQVQLCRRSPCHDTVQAPGTFYYAVVAEGAGREAGAASPIASVATAFDPAQIPAVTIADPAADASVSGTTGIRIVAAGSMEVRAYTLEAWVKPTTLSDWRDTGIVGRWDGGHNGGPMLWGYNGNAYAKQNAGLENYLSGGAFSFGAWQHVAATYDGARLRVYVNGAEAAVKIFTGNVGDGDVWRIGSYGATPYGALVGQIDDVRIYDRALGAGEVRADMDTPVSSVSVPTT
jgi:Concanavalin A-like lectin/glucanases superfamily